ncbi:MAG TPA: lipopolysaccharide biosynthesis protein RfbH [Verrucomicrobiae bacterium]|nr:lipopolysaccharide biosynthesis protein RfbH [Verrucomicrobiae bacterium]
MVTSSRVHPASLPIGASDYEEGALPKESYVRTDRVLKVRLSIARRLAVRVKPAFVLAVRKAIIRLDARKFSREAHIANRPGDDALRLKADMSALDPRPSTLSVPYAGRVFTEDEVEAAVSATLDFWLTLGPEGDAFEHELASFLGVRRSILVNSGSSANLLAVSALTSHKIPRDRRLRPGDEVITCAAGFPTTVAPIVQVGAVPVFVDADPITLNARADQLEGAFVEGKTKAVILAHTLGNPFDLAAVTDFCRRHDLWLIEDNCDSLGSTYDGQLTGTFGDLSAQSFYPPHHITMGEGGAVNVVRDMKFKVLVESFRDWGRDCWCASGKDNTCKKRFGWQLGELPEGYDHKYIYSHLGYNLKPLDIQAAIGREQLKRLPAFVEARRTNWEYLRRGMADLDEFFEFHLPTHATRWTPAGFSWDNSGHRSDPSWFGFLLLVRPTAPFTPFDLARHLDARKIGNRALFGGNLARQPAFVELRRQRAGAFRVRHLSNSHTAKLKSVEIASLLPGADRIMNGAIFVGTFPGLTSDQLDQVVGCARTFVKRS